MLELSHVQPRGLRPSSSETAHEINRSMVLELIRLHGAISRAELARVTGLQKSTVSIIADHLLNTGWVREYTARPRTSGGEGALGRKPTQLSVDDSLAVIAVDIRPGRTSIAAVDLYGRVLSQETFQTPSKSIDTERKLTNAVQAIIARHPQLAFQGIGISVPGRVNASTGLLEFAPNLPWHNWNLKGHLSAKVDLPIETRNAAEAIVLSERWFGAFRNTQDALVITVSEGIGVGILTGGRDLPGARGMAGEFGHVVLDTGGSKCGCGKRGCWETLASNRAVEQMYAKQAGGAKVSRHATKYSEILTLAEAGNAHALRALEEQYRRIGEGLKLVLPLVPEKILFAGDFVALWDRFGRIIVDSVAEHIVPMAAPRLLTTADSTAARLRGATALILQAIYQDGIRTAMRSENVRKAR